MKIVIISKKNAIKSSGSEVRNYYLLKGLKEFHNVCYIHAKTVNKYLSHFQRIALILQGKLPYIEFAKSKTLSDAELNLIAEADIIQLQELESFFIFEKYLPKPHQTIVIDTHNIEYKKFLAEIKTKGLFEKILGILLADRIKKIELKALDKVNYILVCSQNEKQYFANYLNPQKIVYIPNGIEKKQSDIQIFNNNILFMGLLSYGPNSDGVRYYLEHIHPLVKKKKKYITFTIIGRNPPEWLQKRAEIDSSILLKGFVESVDVELQKASVCICPIRYGSGTRLKVLEYMAAGKPVVSTTIGAEGINAEHEKEIIIADSPQDFAERIIELLNNKEKSVEIGSSARKFTEKNYNWEVITEKLSKFYKEKVVKYENTTHKRL